MPTKPRRSGKLTEYQNGHYFLYVTEWAAAEEGKGRRHIEIEVYYAKARSVWNTTDPRKLEEAKRIFDVKPSAFETTSGTEGELPVLVPKWAEGPSIVRDMLMAVIPQTFGEAVQMYGEKVLCGEAHEWDNNTTLENVPFLVGLLCARLNELQGESDRDIGVVEREKRALREALKPCLLLLQDEKPGPDETSTPEEYNDWCDIIEKAQVALVGRGA